MKVFEIFDTQVSADDVYAKVVRDTGVSTSVDFFITIDGERYIVHITYYTKAIASYDHTLLSAFDMAKVAQVLTDKTLMYISFATDNERYEKQFELTNRRHEYKVFSAVVQSVSTAVDSFNPDYISYSIGWDDDTIRADLYDKIIKRYGGTRVIDFSYAGETGYIYKI